MWVSSTFTVVVYIISFFSLFIISWSSKHAADERRLAELANWIAAILAEKNWPRWESKNLLISAFHVVYSLANSSTIICVLCKISRRKTIYSLVRLHFIVVWRTNEQITEQTTASTAKVNNQQLRFTYTTDSRLCNLLHSNQNLFLTFWRSLGENLIDDGREKHFSLEIASASEKLSFSSSWVNILDFCCFSFHFSFQSLSPSNCRTRWFDSEFRIWLSFSRLLHKTKTWKFSSLRKFVWCFLSHFLMSMQKYFRFYETPLVQVRNRKTSEHLSKVFSCSDWSIWVWFEISREGFCFVLMKFSSANFMKSFTE